MRQLTGSFNLQSGIISLAPSKLSDPGTSVTPFDPPPIPYNPGDDGSKYGIWDIIGFVSLGIVILFILICTIHCCYDKYMQEQQYIQVDNEETEENRKEFENIKLNRSSIKYNESTSSSRSDRYHAPNRQDQPVTRYQSLPYKPSDFSSKFNVTTTKRSDIEGISKMDIASDRHPYSAISEA